MPYNNILIPLDGSPDSIFACEIAMNLSCSDPAGRMFHLVHCVSPIPSLIGGESRENLMEDQKNEADKIFLQARNIVESKGYKCRTYFKNGAPGEEIVQAVGETKSEVIIMGTRGLGNLESLFLGSVSREVLRNSAVPVILANRPPRTTG